MRAITCWDVVRVNDDGRTVVVHPALTGEAAFLIAGALRDEMTDEEVGEGWNVEPRRAEAVTRVLTSTDARERRDPAK